MIGSFEALAGAPLDLVREDDMRIGFGATIVTFSLLTTLALVACSPAHDAAESAGPPSREELTSAVEAAGKEGVPDSELSRESSSTGGAYSSAGGSSSSGILSAPEDIGLHAADEYGYYVFEYGGEEFLAFLQPDVWTVFDSYKITNHDDMLVICQALTDEYPIHGSDYASYRTPEDMVFEWEQHNFVYRSLPSESEWRESAKDVDFDPSDQGKTYAEIYEDRTGRELDVAEILSR